MRLLLISLCCPDTSSLCFGPKDYDIYIYVSMVSIKDHIITIIRKHDRTSLEKSLLLANIMWSFNTVGSAVRFHLS